MQVIIFAAIYAVAMIIALGLAHLFLEGNVKWLKENGVIIFVLNFALSAIFLFVIYRYQSEIDK